MTERGRGATILVALILAASISLRVPGPPALTEFGLYTGGSVAPAAAPASAVGAEAGAAAAGAVVV